MGYWVIIEGIYETIFTVFFFLLAFFTFYIAIRGYKARNRYGGSSTFICGILYVVFGVYNLFLGYFPFPFSGFFIWWVGIVLAFNLTFSSLIRRTKKKMEERNPNPKSMDSKNEKKSHLEKYIVLMTKENPYQEKISVKMESIRKGFHLLGFLILAAYFGFFFFFPPLTQLVNENIIELTQNTEWLYNILWGDLNNYPYAEEDFQAVIDLTMFALIGALCFAIISDLIRTLWGPEYSIFNFLTRAILRNKEKNALGPHIYLISGMILSYIFYLEGLTNVLIVFCAILIACLSDASAALIGKKYGKHKVKCIGGDLKTVEGFITGVGSAYLIALIFVGPIYALIAALIFLFLDYFPIVIADNILNPIAITLGLTLFSILFGFPIGWF